MKSLSEILRDDGIQRALFAADAEWAEAATRVLDEVAEQRDRFTSEDVRAEAERRGIADPKEPRAWGGIFQAAAKDERIRLVGYTKSSNPRAHRRPVAVWEREDMPTRKTAA